MTSQTVLCCLVVLSLATTIHCKDTEQELLRELDHILGSIKEREHHSDTDVIEDHIKDEKRRMYADCPSGLTACPRPFSRICIDPSLVCDGEPDCPQSVDERNCAYQDQKQKKSVVEGSEQLTVNKRNRYRNQCSKGFIACGGFGSKCIRAEYLCDGFVDCYADGWDEEPQNCGSVSCPGDMIKCNGTGRCISRHDMCNDLDDCGDLEDENESNCGAKRCGHSSTKCSGTNLCVPNEYWCDGEKECPNGDDERAIMCAQVPCDGVRCSNGKCIRGDQYCDGFPDCSDGGDEDINKCGPVRCPRNTEKCGNANYCYSEPRWRTCDGHPDCPNGADENDEECAPFEQEPSDWYNYERSINDNEDSKLASLLGRILRQIP